MSGRWRSAAASARSGLVAPPRSAPSRCGVGSTAATSPCARLQVCHAGPAHTPPSPGARACPLARHWLSGSRRRLTPSREPPQACTASLSPLLRARGVARRAPGRAARRAAGEPYRERRGTLDDSAHLRAPGGRRGGRAGGPRHPRARVRRRPSAASGRRSVLEAGSGRPRSDTSDTAMARPRPG